MSDQVSELFSKIERYLNNQVDTFMGLPSDVLAPISNTELQLISKRLQNLQQEQEIAFSIDEILPKSKLTTSEANLTESKVSKEPIIELDSESSLNATVQVSVDLIEIEEENVIEQEIDLEDKDDDITEILEDSLLTSQNVSSEVVNSIDDEAKATLEVEESEQIEQNSKLTETTHEETIQDDSDEELESIENVPSSDSELEENLEVEQLDTNSNDEFYEEQSEFSLESNANTEEFNETESKTETENQEEATETPVDEPIQYDLFGTIIPSKPSSKATYKTIEPILTPSLFDKRTPQKEPSKRENSILSSEHKEEIIELKSEPTLKEVIQDLREKDESTIEIVELAKQVDSVEEAELEKSNTVKIRALESEKLETQELVDLEPEPEPEAEAEAEAELESKNQTNYLTPETPLTKEESNSNRDLLEEPITDSSFNNPSKLIATYIPISMIDPNELQKELNNCTTLDALKALCDKHKDLLRTDLEDTNLVFGVGNPNAKLVIIGEAPGENEDKQGEPFVGKAGQLLDKILEAIELSRKDIYIANILKHRPPKNRDPLPEERERSLPFLLRQIEIIQPKLVLCLGRISARTLLGLPDSVSLGQIRGKFHPFLNNTIELTATYHPASLLRNPNWKRPTWEDVQMIKKRYDELP